MIAKFRIRPMIAEFKLTAAANEYDGVLKICMRRRGKREVIYDIKDIIKKKLRTISFFLYSFLKESKRQL